MRLLLRRPGELTLASLEGRRARYVSPVRLYLLCSLVYFVIAAGVPTPDGDVTFEVGIGVGSDAPVTPGDVLNRADRQPPASAARNARTADV